MVPIDVAPPVSLPLSDWDGLISVCAGADVVVHLAARMSWQRTDDAALFETNVLGTANVAEAAALAGAKLVLASTGEVYPEGQPVYQPLDEDHPRAPTSAYGPTKKLAEDTVDFYRRTRGLEAVVLRFSHFQGRRRTARPQQLLLGAAVLPAPQDTRDLTAGVVAAVETPGLDGEVIGLGADDSADFDWLVPELARRAGLDYVDLSLPGPAVHYTTSNAKARNCSASPLNSPSPA
ncbi:NAD-dependent epimerase/dehydratase family protein [Amycolatopsis methanolica]|uniref:NAD-dependent epimerase/dehydratase family protein n=1 Tax=Amycolatopsis methanolica TaxID=1814 RepID=UPI00342F93DD